MSHSVLVITPKKIQLTPSSMEDRSTRPNATIYVGGLDTNLVTAATLSEAFVPFGEIVDVSLPKPELPSSTDLHRGFGYVEFEDAADAKEAIDNMDQSELYGRVIKVAMARPDQKRDGEGGTGNLGNQTAIWEQVSISRCRVDDCAGKGSSWLTWVYYRRGILRSMLLLRRTGLLCNKDTLGLRAMERMIRCANWKIWMWLDPDNHEWCRFLFFRSKCLVRKYAVV